MAVRHDLISVVHVQGYGPTAVCSCGRMFSVCLGTRMDALKLWRWHARFSA